jgi:hypothetical protein
MFLRRKHSIVSAPWLQAFLTTNLWGHGGVPTAQVQRLTVVVTYSQNMDIDVLCIRACQVLLAAGTYCPLHRLTHPSVSRPRSSSPSPSLTRHVTCAFTSTSYAYEEYLVNFLLYTKDLARKH